MSLALYDVSIGLSGISSNTSLLLSNSLTGKRNEAAPAHRHSIHTTKLGGKRLYRRCHLTPARVAPLHCAFISRMFCIYVGAYGYTGCSTFKSAQALHFKELFFPRHTSLLPFLFVSRGSQA